MKTFTEVRGPGPVTTGTTPAMTKEKTPFPPEPLSTSNENRDPNATPPSSPNKYHLPSTPKSTPLHRRFLQEVTMSPATPPRTPSRNKRETPTKGRDSPANGRESPIKQRLEIGQNGFYFSCELPMSKVTPTKGPTPNKTASSKKDDAPGTPTRRTPSPLKNSSPVKKSPARLLFGTPTRKTGTPTTNQASTPVKRAVESDGSPTKPCKIASRFAQGPLSTPVPTLRIPPECLKDVTEEEVANAIRNAPSATTPATAPLIRKARPSSSLQPSNIGQLMASLGSSKAHKTRDWAVAEPIGDTNVSPAPTPLRRASEKLRPSASPTYLRITIRDSNGSTTSPAEHLNASQPPMLKSTLLNVQPQNNDDSADQGPRGVAERFPPAEFAPMQRNSNQDHSANVANGTQTVSHPPEPIFVPTALDTIRQEQGQEYPPPLLPKQEPEVGEEGAEKGMAQPSNKHGKWQKPHSLSSKIPKSGIPRMTKRAGTDPAVLEAMRIEMVKAGTSLRRPTGQENSFQGPVNNNELPAMSNTLFTIDQEAKKPNSAGTPSISRKLSRTNSDTSSISTVRASMVMSAQKRAGTPKGLSTPRPLSPITTPASARREGIGATKQAGTFSNPKTSRTGPTSAASTKSPRVLKSAFKTAQQPSGTPSAVGTPSRARVRDTVFRATPVATPAKSKVGGASIPRGVRKSIFDTPVSTRVTPAAKLPPSTRKPLSRTPLPATTRKPTRPVTPKPYDPTTDPRPYEKKFASAVDIAERVAGWNSEDRKEAARAAPTTRTATISPTKAAAKPTKQKMENKSYTPQGSPTKPPSSVKKPSPNLHPAHPKPSSTPNPLRPAPNTPRPRKTAVNKVKDANTQKTPANRRIPVFDRNALRTPSKAIESSLDRAIDAKIEEDARSGKEFTPSGNRVRDLLEARGRKKGVGM